MLRTSIACSVVMGGVALCVGIACLGACSSDETGTSSGSTGDGATPADSGGSDGGADTGSDGAPVEVNACKNFVDRTAPGASRTIEWVFSVSTAPERCMKIQKGQTVTWNGDFTTHPLAPLGGDKPNPITGAATATFDKVGTYGFECTQLPGMIGAIQVVE